jgi:hypothetical protein
VTIAAQLAECAGKLIVELATDAAMQVRELVGDIIWVPHDRAVLVTLDRLEAVSDVRVRPPWARTNDESRFPIEPE